MMRNQLGAYLHTLCICMIFVLCMTAGRITVWADNGTPESKTTMVNGDYFNKNDTDIVIPTKIGDEVVTSIERHAFASWTNLKSVTIPEGVEDIDYCAFQDCTNLKKITMPSTLKTIGMNAFNGCSSLESITIPSGVKIIELGAFKGCSSLSSVTIEEGVESLNEEAFRNCSGLRNITIPSSVTHFGARIYWVQKS